MGLETQLGGISLYTVPRESGEFSTFNKFLNSDVKLDDDYRRLVSLQLNFLNLSNEMIRKRARHQGHCSV
jgi:hypothetical protein